MQPCSEDAAVHAAVARAPDRVVDREHHSLRSRWVGGVPFGDQLPSDVVEDRTEVLEVVARYQRRSGWWGDERANAHEDSGLVTVRGTLLRGQRELVGGFVRHGLEGVAEAIEVYQCALELGTRARKV